MASTITQEQLEYADIEKRVKQFAKDHQSGSPKELVQQHITKDSIVNIVEQSNNPVEFARNLMKCLNVYSLEKSHERSQVASNQNLSNGAGSTGANDRQIISMRKKCLKTLIRYVNSENFNKSTNEYIVFILDELDSLPESQVASITEFILHLLKEERNETNCEIIDILPKCLSIVYSCDTLKVNSKSLTGPDYHNLAVGALCSTTWTSASTTKIASILKEVSLQEDEFNLVINKIFKELHSINSTELPSLIYQLLLLSAKGKRREIITGILSHFHQVDTEHQSLQISVDNLRSVEGVVLQFIEFAVKQDQNLAKELLKILKEDSSLFNAFSISFLFVVATIPTMSTEVFKLLRSRVDAAFKDSLKARYFYEEETELYEVQYDPIGQIIMETIQRSDKGREYLLKSISEFGFFLLDSKRVTKHTGGLVLLNTGSIENCHQLGMHVLTKLFEIAHSARAEIIDSAFNRIVTGVGHVEKYTELIFDLVRKRGNYLMEHTGRFKETIDYLSYFDPATASAFFEAVGPLVKSSQDFQDSIVLVLRKALYSREQDSRLIALKGFLQILQAQSNTSNASSSRSRDMGAVDSEVLGILRRCLGQQEIIRRSLYEGLADLAKKKEELRDEIAKLLVYQLKNYLSSTDGAQLDKCIDPSGTVLEPLPFLLFNSFLVFRCFADETSSGYQLLFNLFQEVLVAIHGQGASDHDLNSNCDFSGDTDAGVHNQMIAGLYIGVLESLIEVLVTGDLVENEDKQDALKVIFDKLAEIRDMVKKGTSAKKDSGKKGKGKAGAKKTTKFVEKSFVPTLTLQVTNELLVSIRALQDKEEKTDDDEDYLKLVQAYTLDLCSRQLNEIHPLVQKRSTNLGTELKFFIKVGKHLIDYVMATVTVERSSEEKKKSRTKSHTTHALECFLEMVKIMNVRCADDVCNFLSLSLGGKKTRSSTQASQVSRDMTELNRSFDSVVGLLCVKIDHLIKHDALDEAALMLDLCTAASYMTSNEHKEELRNWCKRHCERDNNEHAVYAKSMFKLYLTVCGLTNNLSAVVVVAKDVLGDLGEFATRANAHSVVHGLVGDKTANDISLVLMDCLSDFIGYMTWKLSKTKNAFMEYKKLLKDSADVADEDEKKEYCFRIVTAMEKTLAEVAEQLLRVINFSCQTKLELQTFERVNYVIVTAIKFLVEFSNYILSKKDKNNKTARNLPSNEFIAMTETAGNTINNIFHMVKYLDSATSDGKAILEKARKAIPEIFYRITEYNQVLSDLSKDAGRNLLANFKRAPARQFKYKGNFEEEEDNENEEDEEGDDGSNETGKGNKKRKGTTTTRRTNCNKRKSRSVDEHKDEEEEEDEGGDDEVEQPKPKRARKK